MAWLFLILAIAAIGALLWWQRETLLATATGIHTLIFARLQVVIGIVMAVLPTLNPVAWFDETLTPRQRYVLAGWSIVSGIVTEIVRRYRATDV